MRRARDRQRRSGCPIGLAMDVFGDPWSLLVVRDLMFKGIDTFAGFAEAGEGIATNVLSDRLVRLEAAGIISRSRDAADARRVRYRLTAKGVALAPVLIEIVVWSATFDATDAPPAVVHAMRHDRARVVADVEARWRTSLAHTAATASEASP